MEHVSANAVVLQILLLACLGLIAFASIALVVSLAKFLFHRTESRKLVLAAAFHAGFLIVAWIIWRLAVPEGWTLAFWATLQATVDSQTYGHAIEHAAEVLVSKAIILGVAGGLLTAGIAWVVVSGPRRSVRSTP